nr:hypothetical protein CFP56_11555 [Quercus suber]
MIWLPASQSSATKYLDENKLKAGPDGKLRPCVYRRDQMPHRYAIIATRASHCDVVLEEIAAYMAAVINN